LLSFSGGSSSNPSILKNHPSRDMVQQIRVKLDMQVPDFWHHSRFGNLFVGTYKKEEFQMTLHEIGAKHWFLEGRVRFNKDCKLINA